MSWTKFQVVVTGLAVLALAGCSARTPSESTYELTSSVPYLANASDRQMADIYVPQGRGPFPAILLIHGGGWARGEPSDMDKFALRLVDAGYVVMNLGYRLAPAFRYPAQSEDVAAAHRYLEAHAERWKADPTRVGVMGYSAGGHLALMLGLAQPSTTHRLKAVVSGAGPTDVTRYTDSPYMETLIGDYSGHKAEYRAASPLFLASPDDPPTMLYHGKWDLLVDIDQSRRMAAALDAQGVTNTLLEVSMSGHATTFLIDGWIWPQVLAFLDQHVK